MRSLRQHGKKVSCEARVLSTSSAVITVPSEFNIRRISTTRFSASRAPAGTFQQGSICRLTASRSPHRQRSAKARHLRLRRHLPALQCFRYFLGQCLYRVRFFLRYSLLKLFDRLSTEEKSLGGVGLAAGFGGGGSLGGSAAIFFGIGTGSGLTSALGTGSGGGGLTGGTIFFATGGGGFGGALGCGFLGAGGAGISANRATSKAIAWSRSKGGRELNGLLIQAVAKTAR